MSVHLLTVESAEPVGGNLQVRPKVSISALAGAHPDLTVPMPGDTVQMRLPDGSQRNAFVASFGIEMFERDGYLYTDSPPDDPQMTLSLTGDLGPEDVPAGTEIWLR
jgi:hypothetical protein